MKNIDQVIQRAEQTCTTHGSRLTDKRRQVLTSLLMSDKGLSAYELIDVCKEQFGSALPATSMYRILDFLQSEQLVHKLNLSNKYVACSHIACDHEHEVPQFLICNECQSVKEMSISKRVISNIQKNVESTGFRLVSPQIELNCVCEDCLATAN